MAPATIATVAMVALVTAAIFGIVRGAGSPDGNTSPTAGSVATVDLSSVGGGGRAS